MTSSRKMLYVWPIRQLNRMYGFTNLLFTMAAKFNRKHFLVDMPSGLSWTHRWKLWMLSILYHIQLLSLVNEASTGKVWKSGVSTNGRNWDGGCSRQGSLLVLSLNDTSAFRLYIKSSKQLHASTHVLHSWTCQTIIFNWVSVLSSIAGILHSLMPIVSLET